MTITLIAQQTNPDGSIALCEQVVFDCWTRAAHAARRSQPERPNVQSERVAIDTSSIRRVVRILNGRENAP